MKKVTAYQCSFCKKTSAKIFLSQSGCKKHENRCWLNPARRSCATCINVAHEGSGYKWRCMEKVAIPFASKISDCFKWEYSGTIFDGDDE